MIKKIMKLVGLLTFVCVLFVQTVMPTPAMAQPNLSGIDPTEPGTITIHRFAGSTAAAPTTGVPLNGIPYTVTLVRLIPGTEPTPANLRNPNNFEAVTGPDAFSATESTVNGIASFTYLPHGIFLVTEGTHTVTPESDRIDPFIVGIPRRSADGETWIYDVDVYPKSEADTVVELEKELEVAWDQDLEAMVATWTLETMIPRLIGNATRFEFVDELDARLTFVSDSVVGTYLRMEEIDDVPTQVVATLPASAFTVNVDSDNILTITLTQAGINHLVAYAVTAPAPEGTLTFTFRTTIAEEEESFGELTNEEARIYYNEYEIPVLIPPTTTLFGIEVEKIDVGGRRLDGAVFEVFLDAAGYYPAFLNAAGNNTRFTTVNGVVLIPNLQAGTFYLQEVEAPPGFRLITNRMPVTVGTATANPDRNYVVTVQVVNEVEDGFILPETGGRGAVVLTVVGLVLVGGAVSLALVVKRRREHHD